jgi:hypothetical protein
MGRREFVGLLGGAGASAIGLRAGVCVDEVIE